MAQEPAWTHVCVSDEIPEGAAWPVQVNEEEICLYRVAGKVYATHDRCTHGNANLSAGMLDGHEIECPFHQGRYDVRTGEPTLPPCEKPVRIYAVREDGGAIWVRMTP